MEMGSQTCCMRCELSNKMKLCDQSVPGSAQNHTHTQCGCCHYEDKHGTPAQWHTQQCCGKTTYILTSGNGYSSYIQLYNVNIQCTYVLYYVMNIITCILPFTGISMGGWLGVQHWLSCGEHSFHTKSYIAMHTEKYSVHDIYDTPEWLELCRDH